MLRQTITFAFCAIAAAQPFSVSNVFASHAVLQRDQPIVLWGFGNNSMSVKVTMQPSGAQSSGVVDATGVWRVTFSPLSASTAPLSLIFNASTGESIVLDDILIGDVYLCSGQSNMGIQINDLWNASDVVAAASGYPNLRIFQADGNDDSPTPRPQLNPDGLTSWQPPLWPNNSNASLLTFSAVCYIFTSTLYDTLGGAVPIGALVSAHGGTSIETWISPANVHTCGDLSANGWNASELWNSNIAPLVLGPLPLRAVVWYQGEEDVGLGSTESFWRSGWYGCMLPALIRDWRGAFNAPDMPVLVQQLHAWIHCTGCDLDIGLPLFRQMQMKSLFLPNVGYSTAFDGGDPTAAQAGNPGGTVHPKNKFIPGRRLAATMAGQFMGLPVAYLHPTYQDAIATSVSNGSHTLLMVNVTFVQGTTGSGLVAVPYDAASNSSHCPTERGVNVTSCDWFGIQVNDDAGTWYNATVAITPDERGLSLSAVVPGGGMAAVATRNGYSDWPVVTIYTKEGLPVLTWLRTITP